MVVRASSFSVGYQSDDGEVIVPNPVGGGSSVESASINRSNHDTEKREEAPEQDDRYNYALLIVLYTLQGIPMGLSASIPFLIQQKVKMITAMAASAAQGSGATGAAAAHAAKLSYHANAIFALCSWPFSLKMLWAPIVDSIYFKRFGRRKSWLVPVQALSGFVMIFGANFVEQQLGLGSLSASTERTSRDLGAKGRILAAVTETLGSQGEEGLMNVRGVTTFFFLLYFLMATQDIAVDGWALSMLSKKNRGRGPVCNSIGQNIGYFLSFVGFLAFNDVEASETVWRPLLGLRSMPGTGLVSLGGFVQFMGYFMLATTIVVALIKTEAPPDQDVAYASSIPKSKEALLSSDRLGQANEDDDAELDASQIGLKETYHRLWAVCQLSSVRRLFLILMTYRLPTALSDNVKFLKAVEYGLSKSTTALLSPTVILPLGILVPIVATKVWHGQPLDQFMIGYLIRVMVVPILDLAMLAVVKRGKSHTISERLSFWLAVVSSTAGQAITSSLQFNAQMTFFASRADPAIGGSYMTLLNTAANLGGTWPASIIMWLVGLFTEEEHCHYDAASKSNICVGKNRDPYLALQLGSTVLGLLWIFVFQNRVQALAKLPDDAWRTHLLDDEIPSDGDLESPKQSDGLRKSFAKHK